MNRRHHDPRPHRRRSIRLNGYDYSQAGAYFITACTQGRACLFGEVVDGAMRLNGFGEIVLEEWHRSAHIRREMELDLFVVMPNHVHGIVILINPDESCMVRTNNPTTNIVGAHGRAPLQSNGAPLHRPPRSLGSFIAGFKSVTTRRINAVRNTPGVSVWQRNYYEHVIRDESVLGRVREYIETNPLQWAMDRENPHALAVSAAEPWECRGARPCAPT